MKHIGVLLVNTGSPDSCKTEDVKKYLHQFLMDPYIVDYPHWFWAPFLKEFLLPRRSPKSAQKYAEIWTEHGSPMKVIQQGDRYARQCGETSRKIAELLSLPAQAWQICYQSKFGPAPWTQPATIEIAKNLPKKGVRSIQVFCPGFAIDCLETLHEIAIELKKEFLAAGGQNFEYIPALNASPLHVKALTQIILEEAMPESAAQSPAAHFQSF